MRIGVFSHAVLVACLLSQLQGCTVMKTKQELRQAEIRRENIVLRGNYQSLLKCWDDKAEKLTIDYANQTFSQIYQDIGLAEILVGGAGGKYAVNIELKSEAVDRTLVNAYGTGYLGAQKIHEWLSLLESCQPKML